MLNAPRHLACATVMLAAFTGMLGWTTPAAASAYLGLDGSSVSIDNGIDEDLNPRGLRLRLGMRISDVFDIEGHAGYSNDSSSAAFNDFSTGYVGAFLKGYVPLGSRSALYGLAGVAALEITEAIGDTELSDDRTGFAWGFGMETQLTNRLDLSADYLRYASEDGLFEDISAISLGLKYYF